MDSTTPPSSQTYPANCHCGLITYSVTLSPPLSTHTVLNCNCSICTRNGYLLVYPLRPAVTFHNDSHKHLSKYRFNSKTKDHLFCPQCGTSILIDGNGAYGEDGEDVLGVNVRPFRDVDVASLKLEFSDGRREIDPPYDDSGRWYEGYEEKAGAEKEKDKK